MHPDMWYHLNAIHHHDGCQLVHPAKWDISSMPYVIMTDADYQVGHWTISGCLRDGCRLVHPVRRFIRYIIQFKMLGIDRFVYNSIYHSHSFGFQISHFNSIFTFVLSFQRNTQSMYLFHVLISYTHSCTHFTVTW